MKPLRPFYTVPEADEIYIRHPRAIRNYLVRENGAWKLTPRGEEKARELGIDLVEV